jgi:hypothetical protein
VFIHLYFLLFWSLYMGALVNLFDIVDTSTALMTSPSGPTGKGSVLPGIEISGRHSIMVVLGLGGVEEHSLREDKTFGG